MYVCDMKKYPITFTTDYTTVSNDILEIKFGEDFDERDRCLALCREWKDKLITLTELELHIEEFGKVVFNGEEIEIYNNYRE